LPAEDVLENVIICWIDACACSAGRLPYLDRDAVPRALAGGVAAAEKRDAERMYVVRFAKRQFVLGVEITVA